MSQNGRYQGIGPNEITALKPSFAPRGKLGADLPVPREATEV